MNQPSNPTILVHITASSSASSDQKYTRQALASTCFYPEKQYPPDTHQSRKPSPIDIDSEDDQIPDSQSQVQIAFQPLIPWKQSAIYTLANKPPEISDLYTLSPPPPSIADTTTSPDRQPDKFPLFHPRIPLEILFGESKLILPRSSDVSPVIVTEYMKNLDLQEYKEIYRSKNIRDMERGYWKIGVHLGWTDESKSMFWRDLQRCIRKGSVGWVIAHALENAFHVYCWGGALVHVCYL
ncbi:hypothetical protein NEOLI_002506 [Neolecta irregularis DAH-3]|uniref:Uncharacterized protein n=1 Tax=Neolecta irregularis (strain DAH-3) TaxID=1198029 RepID=A0A1U7LVK2_NEOID|nr:hypothetical protein NEOLI_002506 [Neolecta irregularis DAH-3]|eukprot:OLL26687.1 hypothetical protein NEOLI_002506 [Neolecta irregularis DAH-3]